MTSGLVIFVPEKPEFRVPDVLPLDPKRLGTPKIEFGSYMTKHENIYIFAWNGVYAHTPMGVIRFSGWCEANRSNPLINRDYKHFHQVIPVDDDSWVLFGDAHDIEEINICAALWIANLRNKGYRVFDVSPYTAFRAPADKGVEDITDKVMDVLGKIENLNESTNPVTNGKAIIVKKVMARKYRWIACESLPTGSLKRL